jgi:phosphonate transport system substrate-binding protein
MRRFFETMTVVLVVMGCFVNSALFAAESKKWQEEYPEITLGVITSENEADRVQRYKPVREYLEKELGVKVNWRSATDYAGIIEAMKAKKVELAYYGPASYSRAWLVTNGQVEPILGELDLNGDFGYHSVGH